jgi:hypothetical protein
MSNGAESHTASATFEILGTAGDALPLARRRTAPHAELCPTSRADSRHRVLADHRPQNARASSNCA